MLSDALKQDSPRCGGANPPKGVFNVNKALGKLFWGALVAGVTLIGATNAWAAVAGKVISDGGTALANATVEVWDTYPGGTILASGSTNALGAFSLVGVVPAHVDLRVRKATDAGKPAYYPSIIKNLPSPVSNVLVILTPVGSTFASWSVADYWDTSSTLSTFMGVHFQAGDVLAVHDPDGVLCGLALANADGSFLIHVIGDDGLGGIDEGPFSGEMVDFTLNGFPASPPAVFNSNVSSQLHLTGGTDVAGVTVTGPSDALGSWGHLALVTYQVTNTGTATDTFSVSASLAEGWPITLPPTDLILASGATGSVDILVDVPAGAGDVTVTVDFRAQSHRYSFVQAGASTDLSVSNFTSVWDGGDGGLVPNRFSLAQNYPNPFNPSTEIAFNIRSEGRVRLEVFNLLGQSVSVLVDGNRPAGVFAAQWDGRDGHGANVPTGIYFYRLTQANQSLTRKMVFLK